MHWNDDLIKPLATSSEKFRSLRDFIATERKTKNIYPAPENIYNAFKLCPYDNVKVVIIGQDPYFTPGTAHGLSFSTLQTQTPPSLLNIYKELHSDLYSYMNFETFRKEICTTNDLTNWAKQGFLLLNSCLTVEDGKAGSHSNKGWEVLIEKVMNALNEHQNPIVFMLWGNHAKEYRKMITAQHHMILEAAHPSPLSADKGFFGCKHFSKACNFIYQNHDIESKKIDTNGFVDVEGIAKKVKNEIKKNGYYLEDAINTIEYIKNKIIEDYSFVNLHQAFNFKN